MGDMTSGNRTDQRKSTRYTVLRQLLLMLVLVIVATVILVAVSAKRADAQQPIIAADTTITVSAECPDTDVARIDVELENAGPGGAAYTVTYTPGTGSITPASHSGSLGANQSRLLVRTVGDDFYTVTVAINGVVAQSTDVWAFCGGSPIQQAFVRQYCAAGKGAFQFRLVSPLGPVQMTVAVSGLADRLVTVDGIADTFRTGRPDGTYNIVVTAGGTTLLSQTRSVECSPASTATGATSVARCLDTGSTGGLIETTVTNGGATSADYVIAYSGRTNPPDHTGSLGVGQSKIVRRSGRPDGAYQVDISIGGTFETTAALTVACAEQVTEASATVEVLCFSGDGLIRFTLRTGATAKTFLTQVEGLNDREITVDANSVRRSGRSGRRDGTYAVAAIVDGANLLDSAEVEVDCDPDIGQPTAAAVAQCSGSTGLIAATLRGGPTNTSFVMSGTAFGDRTVTVPANQEAIALSGERADGTYTVLITVMGTTILNETITVECAISVPPAAEILDGCTGDGGFISAVLTAGSESAKFTFSVSGLNSQTVTLLPGLSATLLRAGQPDGAYTALVSIEGDVIAARPVTLDCASQTPTPTPDPTPGPTVTPVPTPSSTPVPTPSSTPAPATPTASPTPISTPVPGSVTIIIDRIGNGQVECTQGVLTPDSSDCVFPARQVTNPSGTRYCPVRGELRSLPQFGAACAYPATSVAIAAPQCPDYAGYIPQLSAMIGPDANNMCTPQPLKVGANPGPVPACPSGMVFTDEAFCWEPAVLDGGDVPECPNYGIAIDRPIGRLCFGESLMLGSPQPHCPGGFTGPDADGLCSLILTPVQAYIATEPVCETGLYNYTFQVCFEAAPPAPPITLSCPDGSTLVDESCVSPAPPPNPVCPDGFDEIVTDGVTECTATVLIAELECPGSLLVTPDNEACYYEAVVVEVRGVPTPTCPDGGTLVVSGAGFVCVIPGLVSCPDGYSGPLPEIECFKIVDGPPDNPVPQRPGEADGSEADRFDAELVLILAENDRE